MAEFNTIEEILQDIKLGKPVVILDDDKRENEGDIIFAAEHATTENVNFMAKYARGLICMPMDASYSDKYNLPQMCIVNTDNHMTAFSVSIDHVDTTTGISAVESLLMIIQQRMILDDLVICSLFRQNRVEL